MHALPPPPGCPPARRWEAWPGLNGTVPNNLTAGTVIATTTTATGLSGAIAPVSTNASIVLAGQKAVTRVTGFIRLPGTAMANYTLKIVDAASQGTALTLGNVTIRSGVEFPVITTPETRTQITLPPGYVPTDLVVKSQRPDGTARLAVSLVSANNTETPVDATMWYTRA